MGVSKNTGTPKSSILIWFSIIVTIHFGGKIFYFWGLTPIFLRGNFRGTLRFPMFPSHSHKGVFLCDQGGVQATWFVPNIEILWFMTMRTRRESNWEGRMEKKVTNGEGSSGVDRFLRNRSREKLEFV